MPDTLTLDVGETGSFTGRALSADGVYLPYRPIRWSVAMPQVATIDSVLGAVTGLTPGTTTVTARSGEISGTAVLVVAALPVDEVQVSPDSAGVRVGYQRAYTALLRDALGNELADREVAWSTADQGIATVDTLGVVTGVAPGGTFVFATSESVTDSAVVVVSNDPVFSVVIAPDSLEVRVGYQRAFSATLRDSLDVPLENRLVTWSSLDEGIATINALGTVTGVNVGETRIVAASGIVADTAIVGVSADPAASVEILPDGAGVRSGYLKQFNAVVRDSAGAELSGREPVWSTGDLSIASVNPHTGELLGILPGTTPLIATVENVSDTVQLSVSAPLPEKVIVSPDSQEVRVGFERAYTFVVEDSTGQPLSGLTATWSTGDGAIASVDAAGLVTGLTVGETAVTAQVGTVTGSAIIGVSADRVASVVASPDSQEVRVGYTHDFTAVTLDSVGIDLKRPVTWSTLDPVSASVDASTGVATAQSVGLARIVAESEGVADTVLLAVSLDPVTEVIVTPGTLDLSIGSSFLMSAATNDSTGVDLGRTVSWSVDPDGVVSLGPDGSLVGLTAGQATVRATSEGQTGSALVTVSPVPVASVTIQPNAEDLFVPGMVEYSVAVEDPSGNPLQRIAQWSLTDSSVASVLPFSPTEARVTGLTPGQTLLIATAEGVADTVLVQADPAPVDTVQIVPDSIVVGEGFAAPIAVRLAAASGLPITGRTVTWTVRDGAIASVPAAGDRLEALSQGITYLVAAVEGKLDSAVVKVVPPSVDSVAISPRDVSLEVGSQLRTCRFTGCSGTDISADAFDVTGFDLAGRKVTWATRDSSVVSPDGADHLTGVSEGTTWLLAIVEGVTDSVQVTVTAPAVASVTIAPEDQEIAVGQTINFQVTLRDARGSVFTGPAVTWSTVDPAVAEVTDPIGHVTGRGVGNTELVATSQGVSDTVTVTVPTKILFADVRSQGSEDIWLSNRNGSDAQRLTTDPASDRRPDVARDGSHVVFQSNRSGSAQIWRMNLDGSDKRAVTSFGGDTTAYQPKISPDGTKIVMKVAPRAITGLGADIDIWIIDFVNGVPANPRVLVDTRRDLDHVNFSPDGQRVIYTSGEDGNREVYSVAIDGSDIKQLTNTAGGDHAYPVYTPDGTEIIFGASTASYASDLFVLPAEGDNGGTVQPQKIPGLPGPMILLGRIDVSADGALLVFSGALQGFSSVKAVRLIRRDGQDLRTVPGPGSSLAEDPVFLIPPSN